MQDLEAFGIAVAGIARDLQDENVTLRARIATLEAQLAAVTPWEIVGRVPTEEERAGVEQWLFWDEGHKDASIAAFQRGEWFLNEEWRLDARAIRSGRWIPLNVDGRPMPKPAHIF